MFDRLVADGDRTTTGGTVIARSTRYNEKDRPYARKENHATCGNCKGEWPIDGTAMDCTDNGYPMVKDRDRVLCPCGKNFVIAAGDSNAFYSRSGDWGETVAEGVASSDGRYDERFTLTDAAGQAVAHAYYTVCLPSGELVHGITDLEGRTERHNTHFPDSIRIYLGHRLEA
ncbi:MAG TPA: PAAR domain-containing protein [Paraburkholderia sp.]|jgi:uncharacterized Zn-binding protein involved in type VI secretion|nr:PAAR domain-containing protein [Paraburkholderia sp.]